MEQFITQNFQETKELAKKIATTFKGGEVIGLVGDLGAGKTVFVQGLAEGLGIKEAVTSPTFVLMKVYRVLGIGNREPGTRQLQSNIKQLVHVDAYRLESGKDLMEIGLTDYLGRSDSVVVIEWADKVKDILPKDIMIINFKKGHEDDKRVIEVVDFA